jgi:ion channel-forming bestrophin family protein
MRMRGKETPIMSGLQRFLALVIVTRRLAPWLAGIAVYCILVASVSQWFSLRPFQGEGEAALIGGLILGLLLGFFNRTAFDRWWEGRRLWGQLVNESRNLAWKVKAYVVHEAVVQARLPVALIGFAEALKRHLRGRVRLQEIPGFEKDAATAAHVPSYLAGLILSTVATWYRAGVIDMTVVLVLDVHTRALLDVCGACERVRNTPISPGYKTLLWIVISLNVLFAPWYTLAEVGFWGIPPILLGFYLLLGIVQIDGILEEPFGTEADDLDLDRYCQVIQESVTDILGQPQLERKI